MDAPDSGLSQRFLFAFAMAAMEPLLERRWFFIGRKFIRPGRLLLAAAVLFERGAILSRAMGWDLNAVAILLSQPGLGGLFVEYTRTLLSKRLQRHKELYSSEEPDNFVDLVVGVELQEDEPPSRYPERMPLEPAVAELSTFLIEGLTFGAQYPGLTERILRREYEETSTPHREQLKARFRAVGLQLPNRPKGITVETLSAVALQVAAGVAALTWPNLASVFEERLRDSQKVN